MRGADLGDPTSQCYVAHCYYYGIGVAKNETKANTTTANLTLIDVFIIFILYHLKVWHFVDKR